MFTVDVKQQCNNNNLFITIIIIISSSSSSSSSSTEDPRYNDSVCYQRFGCKIEFALVKKIDMYPSKLKHE